MFMGISGYSSIGVCTWKKSSSMDSTWTTLWRSTNLLHSKYWDSSWSRSVWSQWVTLHRSWNTSTTLSFRSEASGLTPNTETCSKLTLMETFWVLAMDSNSSRRKSWGLFIYKGAGFFWLIWVFLINLGGFWLIWINQKKTLRLIKKTLD